MRAERWWHGGEKVRGVDVERVKRVEVLRDAPVRGVAADAQLRGEQEPGQAGPAAQAVLIGAAVRPGALQHPGVPVQRRVQPVARRQDPRPARHLRVVRALCQHRQRPERDAVVHGAVELERRARGNHVAVPRAHLGERGGAGNRVAQRHAAQIQRAHAQRLKIRVVQAVADAEPPAHPVQAAPQRLGDCRRGLRRDPGGGASSISARIGAPKKVTELSGVRRSVVFVKNSP